MEHKDYWQAPSSVDSSNKQENEQADGIQAPPKIAKELDHCSFGGKLVIDRIIKLIIYDGDDHVGHKGQDQHNLDEC